ncbi:MAG TPA: FecR domain-containing protein [Rhizomicrobium sp.]|nr:FecR domain-containing protein [Rhizomicrobium sp.]
MNVSASEEQLRDLIAEQAAEFYVAHRSGDLSREQEQEFLRWLRTSPLHVAEYLSIASIARDLPTLSEHLKECPLPPSDEDENVVAINPGVVAPEPPSWHGTDRPTPAPRRRRFLFAAASLALVLTALTATYLLTSGEQSLRYTTARGEQRTWQLADDTIVHLNSDSELKVEYSSRRRNVSIERGQVYFEVAHDASRPFQVRAGTYVLRDIGTSFDVFRKENGTVVSVVEGKVAIWKDERNAFLPGLKNQKHIEDLSAGDQATITPTKVVERTDLKLIQKKSTAWLRQEIVLDNETLNTAAAEFNRYNRTQIVLSDAAIAQTRISGVFHIYGVKSFARFLGALPGVQTRTEDSVLYVEAAAEALPKVESPK